MKKVKAIRKLSGEELPIEKMEIQFIGTNYVIANYKGYGFTKAYGPWDGYTVEFE
jgi:hypothetical protein